MGKVKNTKNQRRRKNHEPNCANEEPIAVCSKENVVQTVTDQLSAASIEEKCCGLQSFAMFIENPENVEQVINSGLVKVAGPLLLDPAAPVRNACAGALRNLSAFGLEACDALMEQDIMTPLVCFFHEHMEKCLPESNHTAKDEDSEMLVNCLNLLWNLCESSEIAIKYVGQSKILDILPRYLDLSSCKSDVVIAVLQCLFVIVEDNQQAAERVKNSCELQLKQFLGLTDEQFTTFLIQSLTAGVVLNTCGGTLSTLPVDVMSRIVSILGRILSEDHRVNCNQLSSNIPLTNASANVVAPKDKAARDLEKQIMMVSQLVDAQQCSIEILANICSEDSDETPDDDESFESDENDESVCNNGVETSLVEDKLPPELLEAFTSQQIFNKVWAKVQLPAENVMLILNEYEGSQLLHKKLLSLQSRALLCVNNMLSSLPIENFGGVCGVYKIWVDAGKLVFKLKTDNLNTLESATAVMRASLDKITFRENGNTSGDDLFKDLALSDIEMMLQGIGECQVPEVRSNLIRMIGILALLFVRNLKDTTSTVICKITEFLLDQAHKESEVWVLAETVDTLVDLYSEDETDMLAARVKLVEKLTLLLPILKNKARQNKRLPQKYKVLVSTATANLPRFIKYKKARVSKL